MALYCKVEWNEDDDEDTYFPQDFPDHLSDTSTLDPHIFEPIGIGVTLQSLSRRQRAASTNSTQKLPSGFTNLLILRATED